MTASTNSARNSRAFFIDNAGLRRAADVDVNRDLFFFSFDTAKEVLADNRLGRHDGVRLLDVIAVGRARRFVHCRPW